MKEINYIARVSSKPTSQTKKKSRNYAFNYWQFTIQVKMKRYLVFISQDDIFNKFFLPRINDKVRIKGFLTKNTDSLYNNNGVIKKVSSFERIITEKVGGFNIVF